MLSKKYYKKFAAIFATYNNKRNIMNAMIRMFEEDNPNFNNSKFAVACKKD